MTVENCQSKRILTVSHQGIDVGTGIKQQFSGLMVSIAYGQVQSGHFSAGMLDRPHFPLLAIPWSRTLKAACRIGWDKNSLRIYFRAVFQQQGNHLVMAFRGGPHQWCSAAPGFHGIHLGTMFN